MSLQRKLNFGLWRDGGDAETGTGMEMGGGLVVSDTGTGLSVDVRVRTLLVHQAEGLSSAASASEKRTRRILDGWAQPPNADGPRRVPIDRFRIWRSHRISVQTGVERDRPGPSF